MNDETKGPRRPGGKPPHKGGPGKDSPGKSGREGGFRKRPEGARPARERPAGGERNASGGDRPDFERKGKPYDGPREGGGEAGGERKPYRGDRKPQGERMFRPRRAEADGETQGERPFRRKPGAPRGDRPEDRRERKPFAGPRGRKEGEGDERKPYRGDRKPAGERKFGTDRPRPERESAGDGERGGPRGPRPGRREREATASEGAERPARSFARPPREDGERSFRPRREDERRERGERGDRPAFGARKPRDDRDGAPAGKRPFRDRAEGGRPPRRETARRDDGKRGDSAARPRSFVRTVDPAAAEGERIAKRLARAGIGSRRDAEGMIADGRISVNGKVLDTAAFTVGPADVIEIDGKPIPAIERTRLFLFHKPAGLVTTNRDPEGRRTIFETLPEGLPRLVTVGRLDINTEGLLLLTNDGGLARVLELPATGWLRRYRVRVHGKVNEAQLATLKDGIAVDGVFYGAIEAQLDREQGSNAWLTIGLREGKNREVKNVLGALGLDVSRLIRISYGPFQLGELAEGAVQELKGRTLRDQLGERLIEEAGANFDAPVTTPFANRPVRGGEDRRSDAPRARAAMEPGEGGLIKNRKRDRDDRREKALGRLQTSKPPMKPKGEKGDEKPRGSGGHRSSNVWMAPGARPQGKKKPQAAKPDGPRKPGTGKRRPPLKGD